MRYVCDVCLVSRPYQQDMLQDRIQCSYYYSYSILEAYPVSEAVLYTLVISIL